MDQNDDRECSFVEFEAHIRKMEQERSHRSHSDTAEGGGTQHQPKSEVSSNVSALLDARAEAVPNVISMSDPSRRDPTPVDSESAVDAQITAVLHPSQGGGSEALPVSDFLTVSSEEMKTQAPLSLPQGSMAPPEASFDGIHEEHSLVRPEVVSSALPPRECNHMIAAESSPVAIVLPPPTTVDEHEQKSEEKPAQKSEGKPAREKPTTTPFIACPRPSSLTTEERRVSDDSHETCGPDMELARGVCSTWVVGFKEEKEKEKEEEEREKVPEPNPNPNPNPKPLTLTLIGGTEAGGKCLGGERFWELSNMATGGQVRCFQVPSR